MNDPHNPGTAAVSSGKEGPTSSDQVLNSVVDVPIDQRRVAALTETHTMLNQSGVDMVAED